MTPSPRVFAGLLIGLTASFCLAQPPSSAWMQAKSLPSSDLTLSFVRPGTVETVQVKQGDTVRQGQLLVQLEDAVEQAQLAQALAEAEDRTRIEAAQARLEQARVDLDKTKQAAAGGGATETEVEHARLEVTINELSLQLAKFQQQQAQRSVEQLRRSLERMQLKSRIDGLVEKIHLQPGESADALQEVIRIVSIDPLWIDVDVPIQQARQHKPVKPGQAARPNQLARVRLGSADAPPVTGRIIFRAAVGDAPSGTLVMRIEVPNPDRVPAGQFCWVRLGSGQQPPQELSEGGQK